MKKQNNENTRNKNNIGSKKMKNRNGKKKLKKNKNKNFETLKVIFITIILPILVEKLAEKWLESLLK